MYHPDKSGSPIALSRSPNTVEGRKQQHAGEEASRAPAHAPPPLPCAQELHQPFGLTGPGKS